MEGQRAIRRRRAQGVRSVPGRWFVVSLASTPCAGVTISDAFGEQRVGIGIRNDHWRSR